MQPTTLHYNLQCTAQETLDALKTLSFSESDAELLVDAKYRNRQLHKISFPWLKAGNQQHSQWQNTVMGKITINGSKLTVSVNSQNRAEQIKREITRRLGTRAVHKTEVLESMSKLLEEARSNMHSGMPGVSEELPAEMQQVLKEMGKKHWQEWLEVVLLDFESKNESSDQPFAPDVDELREVLGLSD